MTAPPSPPKRRRRRVVVTIAVVVVGLCWWMWPRVDPRFVGRWSFTHVGSETPSPYGVLILSPSLRRGAISRNGGASFTELQWRTRGDTLEMIPTLIASPGLLPRRIRWELGAGEAGWVASARFHSPDEIELRGGEVGHVILRRMPQ